MNIVVFNLNGRGWMLHYSSQFSNALKSEHNIRVIVPSYADTQLYDEGIELWKIRTNPTFGSFIIDSLNIFAHIGLLSKIWKFQPDIIQIMDNHPWYFFYPIFGRLIGAKIYVIQHDPFPHSGERKWIFHKVAIWVNIFLRKFSDILIVHGEKMRTKVIKYYGIPEEKIRSIYHWSLDFLRHENLSEKKEPYTFLFFWRIVAYKWLDILIQAVEILEKKWIPYHIIIAWDGDISPYKNEFEKIEKKNITLINRFIDDKEIPGLFGRSRFVVLPYKDATASWIIPLSYSFSLPVIATDVGVLSEYVKNSETGLLVESPNPALIANAIEKLLWDQELTEQLGENAKKFQNTTLSWRGIIQSIYQKTPTI